MKNTLPVLLFVLLLCAACKKEQVPIPETKIFLEIKKQSKTESGKLVAEPISAIIHVWNAEGRDYDVAASPDIHVGSAYDKVSQSYKTMKYGAIGSRMNERLEPGKYFVYVVLPKTSGSGSLAYSYTYFEVKAGEMLKLTKTFSHDVGSGKFEAWEQNQ